MYWKSLILLALTSACNIAYCCLRIPDGSGAEKSPADNRYIVSIGGNPQYYEPGQKYNISLMGIQRGQSSAHTFIGFMLYAENDNTDMRNTSDFRLAGSFDVMDPHEVKFSDKCANLLTHTNTLAKSKIQATWIAPAPGSGCVSFKATVIEHRDVWYMDDGYLTKQFCEETMDDIDNQPPVMDPCCACDEAKYELTFEGKWSRHTHPKDFPANGWRTRFSDIIGASHTIDYRFWNYGEMASEGVREVAEHGSTRKLESELKEKSDHIRTIIKARGISYPNVTGKTFAVFRVDSNHHLISLVSMIDPSPDWIVGVSGLELCLPNCSWVEYKVHNLYPWDTGTDSGPSYMSADQPQVPPDVIRRIKANFPNDPRSPFFDPNGAQMKPLARLHISRRRLYAKNCENIENESEPIECATHPWIKWSECNTKCGRGKIYRTREFKNPMLAMRARCQNSLREEKECVGRKCGNFDDDDEAKEDLFASGPFQTFDEAACALSTWSPWTECSETCGKGTRTRDRHYLNRKFIKKCEQLNKFPLQQNQECEGFDCAGGIGPDGYEIQDVDAPPECQIGEWSDWTPCSATCGIGQKQRTREVHNMNTNYDNELDPSDPCSSIKREEYAGCEEPDCDLVPDFCYYKPIGGPCRDNFSNYFYYDRDTDDCGMFYSGDCHENLNKFDSYEDCNTTCKHKIALKRYNDMTIENLLVEVIDCKVSEWHIRPCNATCGEGFQIKIRKVIRPAKNGGKPCPKRLYKVEKCYSRCSDDYYSESLNRRKIGKDVVAPTTRRISGEIGEEGEECAYGSWSPWSPCTSSCGHSIRQKTRIALNGDMNFKCRDRVRVEKCNVLPCSPRDCHGPYC